MREQTETPGAASDYEPYPVPATELSPALEHAINRLGDTAEHIMKHRLGRRSALYAFVGALAAGHIVNAIEKPLMDMHWGNDETDIVLPDGLKDIVLPAKHAGLASSGFNGTHGPVIVRDLAEHVYGKRFPNGYIQPGANLNMNILGQKAIAYKRQLRHPVTMDLHGVSEGLLIAMVTALQANVPLRMVTGNDAPFDANDVKHKRILKAIGILHDAGVYHGGMLGEAAVFMGEELEAHGMHNVIQSAEAGVRDMWGGLKPTFVDQQAAFLANANIRLYTKLFRSIITPETHFVLLKTQHASTDPIVYDNQAAEKWIDFAHQFGAKSTLIETPMEGHAHITTAIKAGATAMRRIVDA